MALKIKWVYLLVFASLGFYNPAQTLAPTTQKIIFYIVAFICLCSAYLYRSKFHNPNYPRIMYGLLITGLIISAFMGSFFHEQSYLISIQAILFRLFAYSFLYILFAYNLPIDKVEKILVVMGIVGMVVNGVNMLTAPSCFFGSVQETLDTSRGFIRVRTPIIYIVFSFFYSLSQYKISKKYIWLVLCALSYLFIIFWVARQYIVLAAVLGFLFYTSNIKIYKKILLALMLFLVFQYIILDLPFVKNMIDLSETQIDSNADKDDIRLVAWEFYSNSYQTNQITRVFGNGIPSMGNSRWGDEFDNTISYLRVYPSDVGWAGFYFYHGLLALSGLVYLFLRAIFRQREEKYKYISYLLLLFSITTFAGGAILIPQEVVALMMFLYIAYKTLENSKINKS